MTTNPHDDQVLYRVPDAARVLSFSRSVVYELIRARRLRAVKQGGSTRISRDAIREYVDLLEREAQSHDSRKEAS